MSLYFFDSSALAKRYMPETGSHWVLSLAAPTQRNRIFVAQITPVEIVSSAMRKVRSGELTARTGKAIRLLVDRHHLRDYNEVRITDLVMRRAEDLLELYALRAADALQLASALDLNTRIQPTNLPQPIFVCADHRLLAAAIAEGLRTDDPNLHP